MLIKLKTWFQNQFVGFSQIEYWMLCVGFATFAQQVSLKSWDICNSHWILNEALEAALHCNHIHKISSRIPSWIKNFLSRYH